MPTARTSVVPFTLTATGDGTAQHLRTAGDPAHQFSTDAYPAFGGKDEAPSPLFYALASLTSCNQVTATLVAKDLGIALGSWTFEIQGDLDTRVLVDMGRKKGRIVIEFATTDDLSRISDVIRGRRATSGGGNRARAVNE